MTDYSALGEKLMRNVLKALKNDPLIDHYDFLPVETAEANTNPVLCEQHKLGIHLWAAKVLFSYCYDQLFNWLLSNKQSRIKHNGGEKLIKWSQFVVMVSADCMTAWNVRKQLVEDGLVSMSSELRLTELILSKHPKSSEVFFHRKWLLSRLLTPEKEQSTVAKTGSDELKLNRNEVMAKENGIENYNKTKSSGAPLCTASRTFSKQYHLEPGAEVPFISELQVCQDAAERYPNNYHAWTHRLWIFQHCCSEQLANLELEKTKTFLYKHISDHSTYHYRQMLLQYLSQSSSAAEHLLQQELDLCTEFIERYPGHEAIWSHRRAVVHQMCVLRSTSNNQVLAEKLRKVTTYVDKILESEQAFCDGLLHQYSAQPIIHDDQSWQIVLCNRHMACLMRIIQNICGS